MIKNNTYILFFLFFANILFAQNETVFTLNFIPQYQGHKILLDEPIEDRKNQVGTISQFKCYITNITFLSGNEVSWTVENSYHLLDAENPATLILQNKIPDDISFDQVQFNLGTDSLTNISGAMGGDLDPTKGMYWAWNSGYINFKLEGTSPLCKTRRNEFEFHLGGYQDPYPTVQELIFPVRDISGLTIHIKLDKFLDEIDLADSNSIMIPGKEAAKLAEVARKIFVLEE